MRIALKKMSDEKHVLEIIRECGRRESVLCETRSYLTHDLLHYAVEAEAKLKGGFWGNLAAGKTLEEMNDRTGKSMADGSPEIMVIERLVGALTSAVKGRSAAEMAAGLQRFGEATGEPMPSWLTEDFIAAVQERMRRLLGHWKATPYGGTMELDWAV